MVRTDSGTDAGAPSAVGVPGAVVVEGTDDELPHAASTAATMATAPIAALRLLARRMALPLGPLSHRRPERSQGRPTGPRRPPAVRPDRLPCGPTWSGQVERPVCVADDQTLTLEAAAMRRARSGSSTHPVTLVSRHRRPPVRRAGAATSRPRPSRSEPANRALRHGHPGRSSAPDPAVGVRRGPSGTDVVAGSRRSRGPGPCTRWRRGRGGPGRTTSHDRGGTMASTSACASAARTGRPATPRAITRPALVSTTPTSRSKAKASTARAVYGPTPGHRQQCVEVVGDDATVWVDHDRGGAGGGTWPGGCSPSPPRPAARRPAAPRRTPPGSGNGPGSGGRRGPPGPAGSAGPASR